MKVVIDIKEETYDLIRETIAFWRSDERYTVAPIGWQEIADSTSYEERPHGHWISANGTYYCSCCKHYAYESQKFDFCQDCGADMREADDEDSN